jgi:ribose transport system permease protein
MFVITLGPGNVDLSIPACMTLAGTVAMKAMAGAPAMLAIGLALALAVGIVVGIGNYALIRLLRIPPIIATLSSSFIIQSTAIWWNRGLRIKPPEALGQFTTAKIAGLPVIAIAVILLAILMHGVLTRTLYGRSVVAIGQNMRAARLAGIKVERVRAATYIMCATFAGLCGYLLAGFSGGAALNMGEEYLLSSIAVVVIGGTSVAGGFANVPGLWGAALFLFLLVTMLNTFGAGAGVRMILTGLIIIGVIVAASGNKAKA